MWHLGYLMHYCGGKCQDTAMLLHWGPERISIELILNYSSQCVAHWHTNHYSHDINKLPLGTNQYHHYKYQLLPWMKQFPCDLAVPKAAYTAHLLCSLRVQLLLVGWYSKLDLLWVIRLHSVSERSERDRKGERKEQASLKTLSTSHSLSSAG